MLKNLTVLLLIAMASLSAHALINMYQESEYVYKQQNKCIAKKVALGVERKNIKRRGLSCYVIN